MSRLSKILTKEGKVITINTSKTKAIKLRCLDCKTFIQKNIKNCDDEECYLYPYRLGKNPNSERQRSKDIKKYCKHCMNNDVNEIKRCTSKHCSLHSHRQGAKKEELKIVKIKRKKNIKKLMRKRK